MIIHSEDAYLVVRRNKNYKNDIELIAFCDHQEEADGLVSDMENNESSVTFDGMTEYYEYLIWDLDYFIFEKNRIDIEERERDD